MIIYVPQNTPARVIESIRSLLEGDGYPVTAILESTDPEQVGLRIEAGPDYSAAPGGYTIAEERGCDWYVYGGDNDIMRGGYETEDEAIVGAWEDSGEEPPALNDPEAQARAFDIATAELVWHRAIAVMRKQVERNGYTIKHRDGAWYWETVADVSAPYEAEEDATLAAWHQYRRTTGEA